MTAATLLPKVEAAHSPMRTIAFLGLLLLGAALLWRLGLFLANAVWAIGYPYELDYGEGIVWQQMRLLLDGTAYGPIDGFPAIVFHYTPLFHALTGAIAALTGIDELATGRAVSIASTLASAAFAAAITARLLPFGSGRATRWICASAAALIAISVVPVGYWAPLMRVDMLALALSLGGFLASIAALQRPRMIHAAAILFVAAIYARQTMVAAPAAAFLTLLALQPRTALKGLTTALVLGSTVLMVLAVGTSGGFLRHIFLYNVNRIDLSRLEPAAGQALLHAIYIAAAAAGAALVRSRLARATPEGVGWRESLRSLSTRPDAAALTMLLVYLLLSSFTLVAIIKVGSNLNYLIEWMFVLSILAGLSLHSAAEFAAGARRHGDSRLGLSVFAILPALLAMQAAMLPAELLWRSHDVPTSEFRRLSQLVQEAKKPVISDDMVILIRSGRAVQWEPAIFAELASTGVYDEKPFVRMVRNREFAFFITMGERGGRFDERYNPDVADAMAQAYPRKHRLAGRTLHFPAD